MLLGPTGISSSLDDISGNKLFGPFYALNLVVALGDIPLRLFWVFLLILWTVFSSDGISAQESFPSAGFRFRCDPQQKLNGWRCIGSGICPWQQDSKDPTCGIYSFAQYNRDPSEANKMLIVRSKVVTRTTSGNSDIEEIIDSILIEKQKNESFETLCEVNGRTFYWSAVNKKARTIVGITVDENGFQKMSVKYAAYPCSP